MSSANIKVSAYIKQNLLSNEQVAFATKLHWLPIFGPTLLTALLFFVLVIGLVGVVPGLIPLTLIVVGFLSLGNIVRILNTEFVITNKRVLIKTGFLSLTIEEMLVSKIETISIRQGVIGQMFSYGTVIITGTGGAKSPFRGVAKPVTLRKHINYQIESANR